MEVNTFLRYILFRIVFYATNLKQREDQENSNHYVHFDANRSKDRNTTLQENCKLI